MTDRAFEGRVALITGGTSGIGLATAQRLADLGATVAVTHRGTDAAGVADVVRDLESRSGAAHALNLDVTDVANSRSAIAGLADELGRIDILVNSAGTNVQQYALDVDEETWDRVVDVNLKGTFFVTQAVARVMAQREPVGPGGHAVVNVASQMGLVGYHRRAAYAASKAGVVNLTKVLAIEWAQHRIRVNAVAPTFVRTPLAERMYEDESFRNEILTRSPMGIIGEPEDVADGIVYLCGDGARLVTGTTLSIDGGWTAW